MQPVPERLAALEERVRNIAEDVHETRKRVDEICSLIQQGKGAKWVIIGFASTISGALGILGHKLLPF